LTALFGNFARLDQRFTAFFHIKIVPLWPLWRRKKWKLEVAWQWIVDILDMDHVSFFIHRVMTVIEHWAESSRSILAIKGQFTGWKITL